MYSWRFIRTVCFVLLLLPVIHLAYVLSERTMAALDPSPQAWSGDIEAYIKQDTLNPLPSQPIVVVGGQRVKLWHDLERDLAPRPVLRRGLGDAIVEDVSFYYPRLVGFYQPGAVVLLTGDAEFFIRDNKSARELADAIAAFVAMDAYHDADRPVFVFSPLKSPLRPQDHAAMETATELLRTMAEKSPKLTLLDANPLLCDKQGNPRPRYFRSDGSNLNEHGYLRLTALLKAALGRDNAGIEPRADKR